MLKKLFNNAAGSLAVLTLASVFSGCAAAGRKQTFPLPVQETQTAYSRELDRLEAEAASLKNSVPVVFFDSDEFYTHQIGEDLVRQSGVVRQLSDQGIVLSEDAREDILDQLVGFHMSEALANAFYFEKSNGKIMPTSKMEKVCIVLPSSLDKTKDEYEAQALGMSLQGTPDAWALFLRDSYHEMWHCLDEKYHPEVIKIHAAHPEDGLRLLEARHKSEMFSDVAAALEMIKAGYPEVVAYYGDRRVLQSFVKGPGHARRHDPRTTVDHFSGAFYYTSPAHDSVRMHLAEIGPETIKNYSMEDINRVATEITEKSFLSQEELRQLTAHFITPGKEEDAPVIKAARERYQEAMTRRQPQPAAYITTPWWPQEFLEKTQATQVSAVESAIVARAKNFGGGIPGHRQAVISLIEEWRREIFNSTDKEGRIFWARKIALLGVLSELGRVNDLILTEQNNKPAPVRVAQPMTLP